MSSETMLKDPEREKRKIKSAKKMREIMTN